MFTRDGDLYRGSLSTTPLPRSSISSKATLSNRDVTPLQRRVALERRTIHVADLQADPEYKYVLRDIDPIRTELGVPMFRGNDLVGVIILYKLVVQPFTDKQIELVTTFADQAVIAIENTRLFDAEQQRTRELTVSLDEQTATSEVLKVISSSPGELSPCSRPCWQRRRASATPNWALSFAGTATPCASSRHTYPPAFAEYRLSFAGTATPCASSRHTIHRPPLPNIVSAGRCIRTMMCGNGRH